MIASNTMPFQMAGAGMPNTQMFPQQMMGGYGGAGPGFSGGMPPTPNFHSGSPNGAPSQGPRVPGNIYGHDAVSAWMNGSQPGPVSSGVSGPMSPPIYAGGQQPQQTQQPPSGGFSSPAVGNSLSSANPNSPAWMTAGGMSASGWPSFLGDMGGLPPPTAQQWSGMGMSAPSASQGANSGSSYSSGASSPSGGWASYSQGATQTNPYLQNQINGLQTQYNNNLTRNVLPSIQSSASAVGGIGGARQGIAQGLAMGDSQAGFANAAANLMGNDYEQSQNRALSAYQGDQNNALGYLNSDRNFATNQGQLGLGYFNGQNSYNLGQGQNQNQANQIANQYQLGNQGQMLDFYGNQRGQDIQQQLAAMQMYGMGVNGPWGPLNNFGQQTSPYTGNGTTTQQTQQGGGASGAIGGGLSGLSFAHMMGWI
jgi:hypothetical protein